MGSISVIWQNWSNVRPRVLSGQCRERVLLVGLNPGKQSFYSVCSEFVINTCKLQCLSEFLPGHQVLGYGSLDHEVRGSGDLGHPVIRVIRCHHPVIVIRGHPLRNTGHAGCCVTNIHMNTIIDYLLLCWSRTGESQTMAIVYKICDASATTTGTLGTPEQRRINDDLYIKYNQLYDRIFNQGFFLREY